MKTFFKSFNLKKDAKKPAKDETTDNSQAGNDPSEPKTDEWMNGDYEEGQLSIDVYQSADKLFVVSTIAGVKPEDIDISINNDMLTIRGKRDIRKDIKPEDYLYSECYWGPFSRSIILPVDVEISKVNAVIENGILTISLPKAKNPSKQISIKVKEK